MMLKSLDIPTLGLCSMLASVAFGVVFAALWHRRRSEWHLLYWSASSAVYAFTILAFQSATAAYLPAGTALFALLGLSDILIVSGVYSLDGERPFRGWMAVPIVATVLGHAVPPLFFSGQRAAADIGNVVGLIVAMGMTGTAVLREGDRFAKSRGRKLAGVALLAYLPGYVIALVGRLWFGATEDLVALIPTLSDQLLLGMLNLGLLAIPTERAHQRLREAASKDHLTGAWNRAGLAHEGPPLAAGNAAFIAIDIDHFKAINDRHGHTAGDTVLITLSRIARDVAANRGGRLFRTGGDEFVAILPDCAIDGALAAGEAIRRQLAEASGFPATISVGIAASPDGFYSLDSALTEADQALYRAKLAGRDRVSA